MHPCGFSSPISNLEHDCGSPILGDKAATSLVSVVRSFGHDVIAVGLLRALSCVGSSPCFGLSRRVSVVE